MPEGREDEDSENRSKGLSLMSLNAPQPMPAGGIGPDVWKLVTADMEERNALGTRIYGGPLRCFDGRINLIDLYQELLDAVCYMRKEIEERKMSMEKEVDELGRTALPIPKFNDFAAEVHTGNLHWWKCQKCDGSGESLLTLSGICLFCEGTGIEEREVPKLLMLTVSELAEAMEGDRKDLMDDKLPHRKSFEVEIADTFIRLFDIVGRHRLDLDGAIKEKMAYNLTRSDHSAAARKAPGGKKY